MIFSILLGVVAVPAYALLGTRQGSLALLEWFLKRKVDAGQWTFQQAEGSLLTGLHLWGAQARGLPKLPPGTTLQVRHIRAEFSLHHLKRPTVVMRNGVLRLPESEPIVITGSYRDGALDLNLYCRALDVREVLDVGVMPQKEARRFSGWVSDLDLTLQGTADLPRFSGSFRIGRLNFRAFSLLECPGALAMQWRRGQSHGWSGEVSTRGGILELKNITVQLRPSRLIFTEGRRQPEFDLRGTCKVEDLTMEARLHGNFRKPDLRLSSDPPLPQEHLLLILATGKRWKGFDGPVGEGNRLSLDLVADFLDYAALGGEGGKLAQRLGVQGSVLVSDDGRTRGLGVRKSVTDRVGVRYGVEQTLGEDEVIQGTTTTRQKVGAELQVTPTDQISVEAEQELGSESPQTIPTTPAEENQPKEGKVVLKYKKKF